MYKASPTLKMLSFKTLATVLLFLPCSYLFILSLSCVRMETVGAAFVEKESKMRRQGQKRGR